MTKKSKNIASILIFLGIVLTLSIMGYKTLSNGIYVPTLNIGKIQIDGLYLRLNNKLILEIQKLDLSGLQEDTSKEDIKANATTQESLSESSLDSENDEISDETSLSAEALLSGIKNFLFVISYFEKLDINSVLFADGLHRSVHYDGEQYHISSPEFVALFDVEENGRNTELLIHQLDVLQYSFQIKGKFIYQGMKKTLEMDIALSPLEEFDLPEQPTLYIHGVTDFYKIDMEASSSHLYNLNLFKPHVQKLKNKTLNDWLFKNIKYDVLKLHSLRFQSTLDRHFFAKLQKTLSLDLAIEAPNIYLAPTLKPIQATRVILYMRDENLSFLLKEPFFNSSKLDGSEVKIANIFTQPLGVEIAIQSQNAKLDDDLAALLAHFDINLPLRSLDSNLKVGLKINIEPDSKHTKVSANGSIQAQQTNLTLAGEKLNINNLNLKLTHTHAPLQSMLQIQNAKLNFNNAILGTLNLNIDFKNAKLAGELLIDKFALTSQTLAKPVAMPQIPESTDEITKKIIYAIYEDSQNGLSEEVLKINKTSLPKITLSGNLESGAYIALPDFDATLTINNGFELKLNDIAKIYPYSPILQYFGIPNGHLILHSEDFESFILNGEVFNLAYPLYEKDGKKLTRYFLEGKIDSHGIVIGSRNKKFLLTNHNNVTKIILNGYDLKIDEIFTSTIPILAQANQSNQAKEKLTPEQQEEQENFIRLKQKYEREHRISPFITYLEAQDMRFFISDYVIPSDMASLSMRDGNIRADVTYGNGVANVDIANSRAKLKLNNFSDTFLNQVWQRKIFDEGLFNFNGIYDDGTLKGEISMQNTTYRDLAIVQNILALIDTIPALLTFKKPGLGANGYEIKKGNVSFLLNDEYLIIENIDLTGSSIDVEGGGYVKLEDKSLDVVLKASTLKTLADIIDKIPLINYVVLGNDGKFTTGIELTGTLDNPKSEVNIAEDLLFSPFEMVGRILKPIDNLLGGIQHEQNQKATPKAPAQKPMQEPIEEEAQEIEEETLKEELQGALQKEQTPLDSEASPKDSTTQAPTNEHSTIQNLTPPNPAAPNAPEPNDNQSSIGKPQTTLSQENTKQEDIKQENHTQSKAQEENEASEVNEPNLPLTEESL